jgi:hypothetical protein
MKKLLMLVLATFFISCAGNIQPKYTEKDFPPKPNIENFKAEIIQATKNKLKDPDSAKFSHFREPKKAYSSTSLSKLNMAGWSVVFYVNAKNSYGGYTGDTPYQAFLAKHGTDKSKTVVMDISRLGKSSFLNIKEFKEVIPKK